MLVLVWKRADIRESSRLVTFLSAERGRFVVLAKGAHRRTSSTLGKLDFLNRCEVGLSGRGFPLLSRVRLVHEPRALRSPARFLAAMHLAELFDRAILPDQGDRTLFDLALGAFTLAERVEPQRLPVVVAAVELRILAALGSLPELSQCTVCGVPLAAEEAAFAGALEPGLACERHRESGSIRVAAATHPWLPRLVATKGRELPALAAGEGFGAVLSICGRWVEAVFELRPRYRALALTSRDAAFPRRGASGAMPR